LRREGSELESVYLYTAWHPQGKSSGDKTEEDAKLAKQRLAAMEMRQRKRAQELQQVQTTETETCIEQQMVDYSSLLERQVRMLSLSLSIYIY